MNVQASDRQDDRAEARVRWWRLTRKELRETLRDRRTLVTLVLMPLLVYPLLSITFNRFLVTLRPTSETRYVVAVQPASAAREIRSVLEHGHELVVSRRTAESTTSANHDTRSSPDVRLLPTDDAQQEVADVKATLGVILESVEEPARGDLPPRSRWRLVYREGELLSTEAYVFVERRLAAINEAALQRRLELAGLPPQRPIELVSAPLARGRSASLSLAMLVPLILILMTITGAVYPAIDLTAGERERGTLEILIASPVPAYQLLMAKYVAVLTVALLTALVNLTAMVATLSLSGLGAVIFGSSGPPLGGVVLVVALTVLFAMFFSAVLLAITSVAKSFKEAQAYLIPLMLLAISPGVLTLMPQIRLNGWLSIVPLVNTALLAREALEGTAEFVWILVVLGTTFFYAGAAIVIAARVFGRDAISTVDQTQWKDLWHRPQSPSTSPTVSQVVTLLAVSFLLFYLLGNLAILFAGRSLARQVSANALVTLVVFAGLPSAMAWHRRIRFASTFSVSRPRLLAILGGLVLGASLWPWAYELYRLAEAAGLTLAGNSTLEQARRLVRGLEELPAWFVVLTLAAIPACAEEWFFRGFVLAGLRRRNGTLSAIVGSALLFGLFHVLSPAMLAPDRFLPTALLGLFLGWVCVRTSSIVPGIALHFCHNALLQWIALHPDQMDWLWGGAARQQTPAIDPVWLLVALGVNAVAVAMILLGKR